MGILGMVPLRSVVERVQQLNDKSSLLDSEMSYSENILTTALTSYISILITCI